VWRTDRSGVNLPITVNVDPFNSFTEVSKDNNKAVTYLTVNKAVLLDPNLSISYRDIVVSPNPVNETGKVNISAVIRNSGNSAASGVDVRFYHGVPGQGGILLGTQTIPSLAEGESSSVSIEWTNISGFGREDYLCQCGP